MELVKRKIVDYLLHLNIKIGKKLVFLKSKHDLDDYAVENDKIDMRTIPSRIKNILLYDQDIIDKRWSECEKCEFLFKPTSSCKKCGCFMKVKTKVAHASCPVGKWGAESIKGEKVVVNPAH